MEVVIDRIEEGFAVCEKDGKDMINIELSKIPNEAKEGDVLIISNELITIDMVKTKQRKKEIEDLTKDLWN